MGDVHLGPGDGHASGGCSLLPGEYAAASFLWVVGHGIGQLLVQRCVHPHPHTPAMCRDPPPKATYGNMLCVTVTGFYSRRGGRRIACGMGVTGHCAARLRCA